MNRIINHYPTLLPFVTPYGGRDRIRYNTFRNGKLGLIKHLHKIGKTFIGPELAWAACSGHLPVIKYLSFLGPFPPLVMEWSIEMGQLEMVKYLRTGVVDDCSHLDFIGIAAEYGHPSLIEYFTGQGMVTTESTLDRAAKGGSLETVQYLHSKGHYGTCVGRVEAARNNRFSVLGYLYAMPKNKCIPSCMYAAARSGCLEMVKYLFQLNRYQIPYRVRKWMEKHPSNCIAGYLSKQKTEYLPQ